MQDLRQLIDLTGALIASTLALAASLNDAAEEVADMSGLTGDALDEAANSVRLATVHLGEAMRELRALAGAL